MKFRLSLKNAVFKLRGERQEEFFDNLTALNFIDPFRYLWAYIVMFVVLIFFGSYRALGILIWFYLGWVLLYLLVFVGVRLMFKQSLKEQELEESGK